MRLSLRSVLLFLVLLPVAGTAGNLAVDCPAEVSEGEPFQVALSVDADAGEIVVRWLGAEIRPPLRRGGGRATGLVLLGIGMRERQEGDVHLLEVEAGGEIFSQNVRRMDKAYPEQHLEVERRFTELSESDLARHQREKATVRAVLDGVSAQRRWSLPLLRPVSGETTSDFGLRRFFNNEPKQPHGGVDLRAADGTPILACAAGRVALTGDHYFAGLSVYLDHGEGVLSMAFHLSEILVEEGQELRRGDVIGKVGRSGRVTGPHLHWGLSLQGQLVDPLMLAD